jgi:hypothetical protein
MVNPYSLQEVWGKKFVGRQEILEDIIEAPSNALIIGARRIGKTSLLRHLQTLFEARQMPAFYITLQSAIDRKSIGGIFFRHLNGQSSAWFEFNKIAFDIATFRDDFIDALHALNRKLAGQRLVLLLDELDQVFEAGRNDLSMLHDFRGALQNCNNIFSVLAGSPRVNELSEILRFPLAEPFFFGFKQIYLKCFSEAEARKLVQQPGVSVSKKLLQDILKHAYFHPGLIQLLCRVLFHRSKLLKVSHEKLVEAYDTGHLNNVFQDAFEMLSSEERAILLAIHRESGLTIAKLKQLVKTKKINEILTERLVIYGHLKKEAKTYYIANWFLAQWLEAKAEDSEQIRVQSRKPETQVNPKLCFVAMPFDDDLQDVYELAIKPAVKECGYECLRIDKKPTNKSIIETILKGIREARFMIVDVSRERPNCYYEFGLAHGFGKDDVVPIIQKGEKFHFDVNVYPHLIYDLKKLHVLQKELKERILGTVGNAPD